MGEFQKSLDVGETFCCKMGIGSNQPCVVVIFGRCKLIHLKLLECGCNFKGNLVLARELTQ